MTVRIHPATPDRWDDMVTVFGRRGDNSSWCWCRLFLGADGSAPTGTSTAGPPDNRGALRREIDEAEVPPGLIGYLDDQPVGWTRVGPRSGFPRVAANRALARVLTENPGAWWVTCFAVDGSHRGSGIGAALLAAAVEFAGEHGATAVEGHPVDVAALTASKVSGSALFTGTLAMFVAAGFDEVGRTYRSRPVMRRVL